MSARDLLRRRPVVAALTGVALVALLTGGVAVATGAVGPAGDSGTPDAAATPSTAPPGGSASTEGFQDPAAPRSTPLPASAVPVRVEIPRIGVDSGLEDLGIGAAGELTAPVDWDAAGWFTEGPVPGAVGPAIIAGHVDSPTGPAVFARLDDLVDGDEVLVTLSTGDVQTFVVSGEQRSAKAAFPTSDVYGPSPTPALRLITCDGVFDRSTGHYEDNLIVSADLVTA